MCNILIVCIGHYVEFWNRCSEEKKSLCWLRLQSQSAFPSSALNNVILLLLLTLLYFENRNTQMFD